jgi:hypothetical protein
MKKTACKLLMISWGKPKEIAGVECCKSSESLMIQQMYQVWYHTEAPPSAPFAKTIPF